MTIMCSVWDRNVSKFAAVKIFNPCGSVGSSLTSCSSTVLSASLALKAKREKLILSQMYTTE